MEIAIKERQQLEKKEAEAEAFKKQLEEQQRKYKEYLVNGVKEILQEFDGVDGIKREESSLFKNGKRIASIAVSWNNGINSQGQPEEIPSYEATWEVIDKQGRTEKSSGLEEFAKAMAQYV